MKSSTKILIWCFGVILGAFLLLMASIWYIGSQVVSTSPVSSDFPQMQNVSLQELTPLCSNLYNEVMLAKPGHIRKIVLSKSQVNAMLDMAMLQVTNELRDGGSEDGMDQASANFNGDLFDMSVSQHLPFWTPWGRFLNFSIVFTPVMSEDGPRMMVKDAKMGELGVPSSFVQEALDQRIASELGEGDGSLSGLAGKSIVKVETINESLVIHYRPYQVRQLLLTFMQSEGASDRLKSFMQ